jgi:hypothetical protein
MKVASAFESDCEGKMTAGTTKRFCPFRQQPTKMPYIKSVLIVSCTCACWNSLSSSLISVKMPFHTAVPPQ